MKKVTVHLYYACVCMATLNTERCGDDDFRTVHAKLPSNLKRTHKQTNNLWLMFYA